MERLVKIGNHHKQDKLLELLLEYAPNNELAKEIYKNGWHCENDLQYIQDDIRELKDFVQRVQKFFGEYNNMYPYNN